MSFLLGLPNFRGYDGYVKFQGCKALILVPCSTFSFLKVAIALSLDIQATIQSYLVSTVDVWL